jgi:hypothetical protein
MTTDDQKLAPYQRLKSILNDGNDTLTDKASNNLDKLLGIEEVKKENFLTKITDFLKKIDSKIFNKPSRSFNTRYQGRSKRRNY